MSTHHARPGFFEPLACEMQPLVRRSQRQQQKKRRATAPATLTPQAGITVAQMVSVDAIDVARVQRDVCTATRGGAWTLVLTPTHIDARLSDDEVRAELMRQLPQPTESYADLVHSVYIMRLVDRCMHDPADKEAEAEAANALGMTPGCMATVLEATRAAETGERPPGYECIRDIRRRREHRLAAIDRIVETYRRVVCDADAASIAASLASSVSSFHLPPHPSTAVLLQA